MTSQIIDSGKHKGEVAICNMESRSKKDDSPMKDRFLEVRKEIYNHYTTLMEHDDLERKDLFQVMETFSKVTHVDGKRVGLV